MKNKRQEIKEFILETLKRQRAGISHAVVQRFGVNRRTALDYLRALIEDRLIISEGRTKARTYQLRALAEKSWTVPITRQTEEHVVWRETIAPHVADLNENVRDICTHGFEEMLNNVIDHSDSKTARIELRRDAASVDMRILDEGVGIFEKIRAALKLSDPREALLELSKGKFTTAPDRHSGEGIFFSSRMFDEFFIHSGGLVYFARESKRDDWLFEMKTGADVGGTVVRMEISVFSKRSKQGVFDRFSGADAGFFRTQVPMALAKYDQEKLVSRSQARRVLSRFEKFGEVILDFEGVESIGQPFADEIFRVFKSEHPNTRISHIGATKAVEKMIAWVQGRGDQGLLL